MIVKIVKVNKSYKMKMAMTKELQFFISILSAKKYSLYKWLNGDENLKANGAFCFR